MPAPQCKVSPSCANWAAGTQPVGGLSPARPGDKQAHERAAAAAFCLKVLSCGEQIGQISSLLPDGSDSQSPPSVSARLRLGTKEEEEEQSGNCKQLVTHGENKEKWWISCY